MGDGILDLEFTDVLHSVMRSTSPGPNSESELTGEKTPTSAISASVLVAVVDLVPFLQDSIKHPDKNDDAAVGIVPTVEDGCGRRSFGLAGVEPVSPRIREGLQSRSRTWRSLREFRRIDSDSVFQFLADPLARAGKVDLFGQE